LAAQVAQNADIATLRVFTRRVLLTTRSSRFETTIWLLRVERPRFGGEGLSFLPSIRPQEAARSCTRDRVLATTSSQLSMSSGEKGLSLTVVQA